MMKISITIPKRTGMAEMSVDGVKGPVCLKRTEALRDKLAARGKGLRRTKDFEVVEKICLQG